MVIKNGDTPAMPITNEQSQYADMQGLTKREMFCLKMGVAETGDSELDAIISKGNMQKMAMHMMASRGSSYSSCLDMAIDAVEMVEALLAELEERASSNK